MSLLFIIIYSAWLLSEIILNRLLRSGAADKKNADRGSLSLIWITIFISIPLAVFISMRYYFPISFNPTISYAGLALILTGILLRIAIVKSLGKYFTVDVTIRSDHRLKKDGFYNYLRHPSYFASLLSFIGFGLSLNNWVSLLLITIAILVVFIVRIKIEEKALIEQFGSEYIEYKKQTRRLIPFIY